MTERPSIVAAGPLTLAEAEAVLSSVPPPGPGLAGDEEHTQAPQSQSAPTPDYSSDLPPEVEACSCEEALALRAEVERLRADIAALTADYSDLLIAKSEAERGEKDAVDALDANWVTHQRVVYAESRHAAATALLKRCRAGFDWNQYDDPVQNQIGRDLDAFLADQSAAPARAEVEKR